MAFTDKKTALFLGCVIPSREQAYELASRKIMDKLGVEYVDVPEFRCCGYPAANSNHDAYYAMSARNLAIAEKNGMNIVALCNACAVSLTKVCQKLNEDPEEMKKVNETLKEINLEYTGCVEVKHFIRFLKEDIGEERIGKAIKKPLKGLKCAAHAGCHFMKPSSVYGHFDNPIKPRYLDDLINATGAESVEYIGKEMCCGGGILAIEENIPMKMVKEKLDNIEKTEADCMVLNCGFCAIMYDEYQKSIEEMAGKKYKLPVIYYPQLLGLAMGMDPKTDLALNKNAVKTKELVKRITG
jgi:heterodisulfide reductase subunit B